MKTCNKCKSYKCTCQQKIVVSAEPQKIIERVIVESKPCPGPKGDTGDTGPRGPAGTVPTDYVSDVEYNSETNSLDFTGIGRAFDGSVELPFNVPKIYTAFFAQTVMNNPDVTVLRNTTGGVFTWTRANVGRYQSPIPAGLGTLFVPFASNYVNGATAQKIIDGNGEDFGTLTIYITGGIIYLETYDLVGNYVEYSSLLGNTVIALPKFEFYA
jgi:hypothetical protein